MLTLSQAGSGWQLRKPTSNFTRQKTLLSWKPRVVVEAHGPRTGCTPGSNLITYTVSLTRVTLREMDLWLI